MSPRLRAPRQGLPDAGPEARRAAGADRARLAMSTEARGGPRPPSEEVVGPGSSKPRPGELGSESHTKEIMTPT